MNSPFGGLILALDTAAREGSAALAAPPGPEKPQLEVLARVTLRAEEEHASLLIPRINALMEEIGADREEISGVVVGAGLPGHVVVWGVWLVGLVEVTLISTARSPSATLVVVGRSLRCSTMRSRRPRC